MIKQPARDPWVIRESFIIKDYRDTAYAKKKARLKRERQALVKQAMEGETPPTLRELALRFSVNQNTIREDIKSIGAML
jgi:DNA-binding FadR family transcriptional regulator